MMTCKACFFSSVLKMVAEPKMGKLSEKGCIAQHESQIRDFPLVKSHHARILTCVRIRIAHVSVCACRPFVELMTCTRKLFTR